MSIHPYTLLPHQLAPIRKLCQSARSPHIRQRSRALLMLHAGHRISDIAEELSSSVQTINAWWECHCDEDLFQLLEAEILQDAP